MSFKLTIFEDAAILDVTKGALVKKQRVVIEDGRISKISPATFEHPISHDIEIIDLQGMTLMPGLCDAHVHVTSWTANLKQLDQAPAYYTAIRSAEILSDMLMRGFTTVRDEGGADFGLALAVEEGYIAGPTFLFCGRALSQTGGHADQREPGVNNQLSENEYGLGILCDGVPAVRKVCRNEIRKGAHHIKLMLSGGVVSPTDRITNLQFSLDEIKAAVEEASIAGLYCSGHTYTAEAVNRAIRCGIRSLEHCNLIDESSIELFLKHNAFMVPTLSTYESLAREGLQAGILESTLDKLHQVREAGIGALTLAHEAGVKIVYGTDLLGSMHQDQLNEFKLRSTVQSPIDIIRSATTNAADLFNKQGEIGVVAEGAYADLLVVDGDPLADILVLTQPEKYLKAILKRGIFVKNALP